MTAPGSGLAHPDQPDADRKGDRHPVHRGCRRAQTETDNAAVSGAVDRGADLSSHPGVADNPLPVCSPICAGLLADRAHIRPYPDRFQHGPGLPPPLKIAAASRRRARRLDQGTVGRVGSPTAASNRHRQPGTHLAIPRAALFGIHPAIHGQPGQTEPRDLAAEMITRLPVATATFSETFQVQPTDGDLRRHVLRHRSHPVHTRSGCKNAIIKPKSRDDDKTRLIAFATCRACITRSRGDHR